MTQMLDALTDAGHIENFFFTAFISCLTCALVHVKVLTTQEAYHAQIPGEYLESLGFFIMQAYEKIVLDAFPARMKKELDSETEKMRAVITRATE